MGSNHDEKVEGVSERGSFQQRSNMPGPGLSI